MSTSKPMLFIDTEFNGSKFNGFGGELISMAIVGDYGNFYETIRLKDDVVIDPWVIENVIPVINQYAVTYEIFQDRLRKFLSRDYYPEGFIIVADWPEDIKYFCESLIKGPGHMMDVASFEMRVDLSIDSSGSKIPHNALEDAISIRRDYENNCVPLI